MVPGRSGNRFVRARASDCGQQNVRRFQQPAASVRRRSSRAAYVSSIRLEATGLWNLVFVFGILLGGFLASHWAAPHNVAISQQTRLALTKLGIHDFSGLAPREVFTWSALLTVKGFVSVILGGFLVGFGTAYAGGCTSGHAISGLADLQFPSLVATVSFFAGGLIATHFILPLFL